MHRNLGIGSWIARRARMTPERVALIAEDQRWTYAQLDDRITCLAHALLELGIASGDRVAFIGDNHPAALETLFACGLVGAILVPLHPGFDAGTIQDVLVESGARALITTLAHANTVRQALPGTRITRAICTGPVVDAGLESYEQLIADAATEPLDRAISLSAPCVLAFTSGTDSRNKGVVLSHANLFFNVVNLLSCIDYRHDDVVLTTAPLYRMGGLGFTLPVLFKGGTCVLMERRHPAQVLALVEQHRVTALFDAPRLYDEIARDPHFATADLSSLRIVVTGGAPVPPSLIVTYLARGIRLRQGYGLTEAAPVALLLDSDDVSTHVGAAGRPPMYGAVRIIGPDREDVPAGTLGELLYSGPNVMTGYWRRPDATARVLVEDGWLRTGDAANVDADGIVAIAGRVSDVLDCGQPIPPGPIEDAVRTATDVECALVQRAPGSAVIAFVAAHLRAVDVPSIATICDALLPAGYSVEVRVIDALPRNANGKVLRGALRAKAATNDARRA